MEARLKERHRKGIANRPDPESCAGGGNIVGEALTGAHAGHLVVEAKGDDVGGMNSALRKAAAEVAEPMRRDAAFTGAAASRLRNDSVG